MVDRLTDEERILAWQSSWNPSFDGVAIINEDFTFRSVNPQFCKLLGVTPADLIGNRFQDVTPIGIRELDEKNAQMVKDGLVDFYLLPKAYQFSGKKKVNVVLLVTRVPLVVSEPFRFFLSRIMLDENGGLVDFTQAADTKCVPCSPKQTNSVVDFATKYFKEMVVIGGVLAGLIIGLLEYFT